MKKELSIIIPVGDDPRIIDTLLSIVNSSYLCNIEVILIDNNCQGELKKKVLEFQDIIDLIVIKSNSKKIGKLRNIAIKKSSSDVLYFIDSDCMLDKNAIQIAFEESKNNSIITGKITFVGGNKLSKLDAMLRQSRYDHDPTFAYCPNLVVKKSVFEKIGHYNESYHYGSDGEFARRVRKNNLLVKNQPNMLVIHDGPIESLRVIKTWVRYGEGRYKRLRKANAKERLTGLFSPNLFNLKKGIAFNCIFALCIASRWYGWIKQSFKQRVVYDN